MENTAKHDGKGKNKGKKNKRSKKFVELYKRRVFRTIEKYKLMRDDDVIFIGLSGGKDSGAAAYMLAEYKQEHNVDCKLYAFHINFNLPFSEKVENAVKKQAEILDLPLISINVADYGIDMAKVAKLPRPICSSCGVIKRYLMNKIPREKQATKLATGHHGDDFLVFFFKNLLGQNFSWSSKFTPLLQTEGKSLARIRPLFFVTGKENKEFCQAVDFPYIEENICPYASLKYAIDTSRARWYEIIDYIEGKQPNFKIQALRSIAKLARLLTTNDEKKKSCTRCGEPTNAEVCAFCRLVEAQKNIKI